MFYYSVGCHRPYSSLCVNLCLPQGDFTWSSLSGRSVRLTPVDIQSLSELERARLQEVAYTRLHQDYDLGCQITMPKGGGNIILMFMTGIYCCNILQIVSGLQEPDIYVTCNCGNMRLLLTLELLCVLLI